MPACRQLTLVNPGQVFVPGRMRQPTFLPLMWGHLGLLSVNNK